MGKGRRTNGEVLNPGNRTEALWGPKPARQEAAIEVHQAKHRPGARCGTPAGPPSAGPRDAHERGERRFQPQPNSRMIRPRVSTPGRRNAQCVRRLLPTRAFRRDPEQLRAVVPRAEREQDAHPTVRERKQRGVGEPEVVLQLRADHHEYPGVARLVEPGTGSASGSQILSGPTYANTS